MAERENRRDEKSDRQTRGNRGGGIKCLDGYPPVFQQIITTCFDGLPPIGFTAVIPALGWVS